MNIIGKITGIRYKKKLKKNLPEINLRDFDINKSSSSSIILHGQNSFAVSKWVSPKRTRSYPYERIYDTIGISKKITVIPIIKDEGKDGDRDFLQWDSVSLMSLIDVYVVFAYYSDAKKKGNKISNQEFDNDFVISQIKEIINYHSSALHWNLKELKENFLSRIKKVKSNYLKIENKTKVKLHDFKGIDLFMEKITENLDSFMEFSRDKSKRAQSREILTIQPKENLVSGAKAKITISNYLGGLYYFTVDEVMRKSGKIELIECKHSKNSILPSVSDIKDGLLKMILYSNLENVCADGKMADSKAVLKLTSQNFNGNTASTDSIDKANKVFNKNRLSQKQISFLKQLFEEARENNFTVKIEGNDD
jgi:hypothetical protein